MNLVALPAFTDNYIWMLSDGARAVVVDPGDAAPVMAALEAQGLELVGILVTHHHPDHVGGVDELRGILKGPVFGPARERIPLPFTPVHDGDRVDVLGQGFEVIEVPGHTAGHIAYREMDSDAPVLFCGDTLFSAGCGRVFEGTPAQLHASLERLNALPASTRVCCTHEYTLSNLRFAAAVEPANDDIASHTRACQALRERDQPTLPSTLSVERRINPFLRCREPEVIRSALSHGADQDDPVAVFTALREWKNTFR